MHSRFSKPVAIGALLLAFGSCEALGGALPTSLEGIVSAASGLSDNLGGFVSGLDVGSMLKGTKLEALTGLIGTGKGLSSGLEALPADVTDQFSIDGLKNALGGLTNFDTEGLSGAATADEQSGFLKQLASIAKNIGGEADVLTQQMSQ